MRPTKKAADTKATTFRTPTSTASSTTFSYVGKISESSANETEPSSRKKIKVQLSSEEERIVAFFGSIFESQEDEEDYSS